MTMGVRTAARLAWVAAGIAGVLSGVNWALMVRLGAVGLSGTVLADAGVVAVVLAFAVLGALIVSRMPGLNIGWMYVAIGLLGSLAQLEQRWATLAEPGALKDGLMWLGNLNWNPIMFIVIYYLPLYFPNGRLPSARWRALPWVGTVWVALFSLWYAVQPGLMGYPFGEIPNPYGIQALRGVAEVGTSVAGLSGIPLYALAVASAVVRFRRARGVERQQLKWFAAGAAVIVLYTVAIVASILLYGVVGAVVLIGSIFPLAFAAIPLATGLAILRYRLWDVDVVINRALVYGALTAALAATYWAGVVLLQQLLRPVTQGSELTIAAATLMVAALFQPLRRRIQAGVDRRFYRRKYDAQRTLAAFNARLRQQLELDSMRRELVMVAGETVQPVHASLWLRPAMGAARRARESA